VVRNHITTLLIGVSTKPPKAHVDTTSSVRGANTVAALLGLGCNIRLLLPGIVPFGDHPGYVGSRIGIIITAESTQFPSCSRRDPPMA
jgi:hypothetical protein